MSDAGRRPAEAGEAETRSPTIDQSRAFQDQFDYLNSEVIEPAFGVRLRSVMLAFSRRAGDGGFFASRRWSEEQSGCRHEVGLHPATLRTRAPSETSATIVHQMVHAWQHDHGPPGRGGYHNGEWAAGTTKRSSESKSKSKSKASYACPGCALSIWGKPGLDLNCNKCQERLVVRL